MSNATTRSEQTLASRRLSLIAADDHSADKTHVRNRPAATLQSRGSSPLSPMRSFQSLTLDERTAYRGQIGAMY